MNNTTNGNGNFDKFAEAIRMRESGDNYNNLGADPQSKNPSNLHYGAYQMGYAALAAAGFIETKGDLAQPIWTPLAKSMGVDSVNSFLAVRLAQDFAFSVLVKEIDASLRSKIDEKNGTIVKSQVTGIPVYVTESGILAAAHLVGPSRVKQFIDTNGKLDPSDGNHVHLSEYMADFAGYGFTFNSVGTAVDTPNVPAVLLAPGLSAAAKVKAARDLAQEARKTTKPMKKRAKQPRPLAPIRRRLDARRKAKRISQRRDETGEALETSVSAVRALRQAAASRRQSKQESENEPMARPWKHTMRLAGQNRPALVGNAGRRASIPGVRAVRPAPRDASTSLSQMLLNVRQLRSVSDDQRHAQNSEMAQIQGARRKSRLVSGAADKRPSLTTSIMARVGRQKMPSLAPIGARQQPASFAEHNPGTRLVSTHREPGQAHKLLPESPAPTSDMDFARKLDDVLSRQARLPPSGMTGFDPRLTPAWAGQKISV